MNSLAEEWIHKCKENPEKYRIDVDNDSIFVVDISKEECVFDFNDFGYHFIVQLLRHIGCNADYV